MSWGLPVARSPSQGCGGRPGAALLWSLWDAIQLFGMFECAGAPSWTLREGSYPSRILQGRENDGQVCIAAILKIALIE